MFLLAGQEPLPVDTTLEDQIRNRYTRYRDGKDFLLAKDTGRLLRTYMRTHRQTPEGPIEEADYLSKAWRRIRHERQVAHTRLMPDAITQSTIRAGTEEQPRRVTYITQIGRHALGVVMAEGTDSTYCELPLRHAALVIDTAFGKLWVRAVGRGSTYYDPKSVDFSGRQPDVVYGITNPHYGIYYDVERVVDLSQQPPATPPSTPLEQILNDDHQ